MNKIIITGPESSGKTTLASQLADFYNVSFVPEYARTYLDEISRPYIKDDLLHIAKGQIQLEHEQIEKDIYPIICDTSMLVLKVWSTYKYGNTHPWILNRLEETKNDFYLLCQPDIPWEPDPLRENPQDRNLLFDIYFHELEKLGAPFSIISGQSPDLRLQLAIKALEKQMI